MKMKQYLLIGILFGAGLTLSACSPTSAFDDVNKTTDGVALRGYDAVAYFAANKAVEGDPRYEYVWKGSKWLFSSAENLEKFKAAPENYAPQFGGYCSYAVSKGYTADGDPNAWKIVNGKLYLNYSPEVKRIWEQDQEQRIQQGEKNWVNFNVHKPEHKS
jgi:YHS domain-containing protein